MADTTTTTTTTPTPAEPGAPAPAPDLGGLESLLAEHGYACERAGGQALRVRDLDSGITLQAGLEADVLFLAVTCTTVADTALTAAAMRQMLRGDNGIATSAFRLYGRPDGRVAVTLNNFCKLQAMCADDADDVLSCIEFLLADVVAARQILADLVG